MLKKIKVLILGLFFSTYALVDCVGASWVGFTAEELIEKSDVILIGEIVGTVGEERINSMPPWVTHWKVKVYYYLKGTEEAGEFIVSTPGAPNVNKSTRSSIDYRLNQWGKTVLLFLHQREGLVEPLSPQGVVVLEKKENMPGQEGQIKGEDIAKQFVIVNAQSNDKTVFERYIIEQASPLKPKPIGSTNKGLADIITLAVLTFIFAGIWYSVRKSEGS